VFTADPRVVPTARKLPMVSFEEMLEMAASGAKVLQLRSVEYARTHGVRIHCRSSFEESPGTFVIGEDETMEHPLITAVTHSTEEARITLTGVPDRPGAAAAIFRALADANCNVDTIIQNEPREEGRDAEVSFTIAAEDLRAAECGRFATSWGSGISTPIQRSERSRSSAPECALTRVWPRRCSRRWPSGRSTSR
jgi:aspartate kinase